MGAYISIVPMTKNRNIIEKNIRSLKTELVEPAIFGNDMFQKAVRKVVVSFYTEQIMCCKTRYNDQLLLTSISYVQYSITERKLE